MDTSNIGTAKINNTPMPSDSSKDVRELTLLPSALSVPLDPDGIRATTAAVIVASTSAAMFHRTAPANLGFPELESGGSEPLSCSELSIIRH